MTAGKQFEVASSVSSPMANVPALQHSVPCVHCTYGTDKIKPIVDAMRKNIVSLRGRRGRQEQLIQEESQRGRSLRTTAKVWRRESRSFERGTTHMPLFSQPRTYESPVFGPL